MYPRTSLVSHARRVSTSGVMCDYLATISLLSGYDEGHPRVRQLQLRGMQRRRNRAVVRRGRMCRAFGDDRLQRVPRCDLRPPPAIGETIGAVQQRAARVGARTILIGRAIGFA